MSMDLTLSRTAENRLEALENGTACLELRRTGMSIGRIAEQLGLAPTNVRRLIARSLKEFQSAEVAEVRALEVSRLEAALEAIWSEVEAGNLRAIDRMLRISQSIRAIYGADQPPQGARDEEFHGPALLEIVPYQPASGEDTPQADDAVVPASIEGVAE